MVIELQNIIDAPTDQYVPLAYFSNPYTGVSPYIESMFPQFVAEDHERFITFMRAYYDWMESNNNVLNDAKRLTEYQDIDDTREPYLERFFREFLINFPRNVNVNKATLLKNIKDFYRARGSEKSFELFFRVIYNLSVEFYYPKDDILKVSDGKWIQKKALRVFAVTGNPLNLKSFRIRGVRSNSTAYVEEVFSVSAGTLSGYELILNVSSITGEFIPEELVRLEDSSITARISATPQTIEIVQPGSGYSVGEKFSIESVGSGAVLEVESITDTGGVQTLKTINYGLGYNSALPLNNFQLGANGAYINIAYSALIEYDGYYLNEDGQISTLKYLHDGNYYQNFSYVTFVDESLNQYKDLLETILHPAGFKLFGGLRTQKLVDAKVHLSTINHSEIELDTVSVSVASASLAGSEFKIIDAPISNPLGPTNYSVYRDRFRYKPVSKYNANEEISGVTNYFGVVGDLSQQEAISPISSFDDMNLTPKDLDANLTAKTNRLPDAVVLTEVLNPPYVP